MTFSRHKQISSLIFLISIVFAWIIIAQPTKAQQTSQNTFQQPFSSNSIWKRKIPKKATYYDVSDAIWGKKSLAPNRVSIEQVTLIFTDPNQPEVSIVKSKGWYVPGRSKSSGQVFYKRRFAPDAGIEVRYPRGGNASFVIIDPKTGIASEGSAGWRERGGDLITFYDEPRIHNINLKGSGLSGTLASGLPALGGLIRLGEISKGIDHSVAIAMGSRRFSKSKHFVAPAWRADSFAKNLLNGYFGNDPRYTMGTLLAIPYSINIEKIKWQTPQGKILARANQQYGWIIVDSNDGGLGNDQMKLNFSRQAANKDLGLEVNPENGNLFVAHQIVDIVGLEADIIKIMTLVKATTK